MIEKEEKSEKTITTLAELEREAARFVRGLAPFPDRATLVTLSGELGAGKTAFAKAVAKTLGISGTVTSPTFVLEKIYALPAPRSGAGFARLVHIDAYRLNFGRDLTTLGFADLMRDPSNLILLEWPEMVADALPKPAAHVTLTLRPDASRTVNIE